MFFKLILILVSYCTIIFAQNITLNGNWFECEFAISGRIPLDNCNMLDDDGFLVEDEIIYHLKVKNSKEDNCRSNRIGHCFSYSKTHLEVFKSKIGKFEIGEKSIKVKYMGCNQNFLINKFNNIWKVSPDINKCFWTRDKNFFLRKWEGKLIIK